MNFMLVSMALPSLTELGGKWDCFIWLAPAVSIVKSNAWHRVVTQYILVMLNKWHPHALQWLDVGRVIFTFLVLTLAVSCHTLFYSCSHPPSKILITKIGVVSPLAISPLHVCTLLLFYPPLSVRCSWRKFRILSSSAWKPLVTSLYLIPEYKHSLAFKTYHNMRSLLFLLKNLYLFSVHFMLQQNVNIFFSHDMLSLYFLIFKTFLHVVSRVWIFSFF